MLRFRRRGREPSSISLADRARDAKQWEVAVRHYRAALSRHLRAPPIWVQYGHALKELGNFFQAEAAYRRAIALDATAADPYLHLGQVLKFQGKLVPAASAFFDA